MGKHKGTIGILTGGGDVPGLHPALRAVTFRALREGYQVLGIRRGWAGLVDLIPSKDADNSGNVRILTEDVVNRAARTGGTFRPFSSDSTISATVRPSTGCTQAGAISASGARTNARVWARGCGITRPGSSTTISA